MRRLLAVVVAATAVVALTSGTARAATGSVHIRPGGAPDPPSLTVNDGDTVTIFNDDDVAHAIFALGQQQGPSIAPHSSGEYGPFNTGGTQGRFDYRVDSNGPAGVIIVRTRAATTSTTRPPTTTTTVATTTTTSTTVAPTTTSTTIIITTTTTTSAPSTTGVVVVGQDTGKKKSNGLAVIGFMLLLAGLGGFVLLTVTARRRQNRRR